MLETDQSSSDTDADWRKIESQSPFLRIMALGKAKHVMSQYIYQDIEGLDTKLLFGVYQRKVLGAEEQPAKEPVQILERIIESKQIANQIVKQNPNRQIPVLDTTGRLPNFENMNDVPETKNVQDQVYDPYKKNDPTLNPQDKSYLAKFYYRAGGSKFTTTNWD